MFDEKDIYRAAKLIIEQNGEAAIIEAALMQDKFLSLGDRAGAKIWSKIGDAIEWMQSPSDLTTETQQ